MTHSEHEMHNKLLDNPFSQGVIVAIDKPLHWTSFDVVNKVRYQLTKHTGLKKLKVGHAGTLDPLATGVVVLCTGKATKQIESLQAEEKCYSATIALGATTPSFDLETEIDAHYPTDHITEEMVCEVLKRFVGEIQQVPPIFSACKVDGKRAYDIARKGQDVELTAKTITIYDIKLVSYAPTELSLEIICSKGTYIRALARDLGEALNSGAHLTALSRLRSGRHSINEALSIDEISTWINTISASHTTVQTTIDK